MFFVNIDVSEIQKLLNLPEVINEEVKAAGRELTTQVHAYIVKKAEEKLHTRREMFLNGLNFAQVNEDTWVISLDANARWIDDGLKKGSMLDGLLGSPKAKTSKDGEKYIVVPFQHNKGPTQSTPAQQNLLSTVKQEMAKFKIPYGKLEMDAKGQPKLGLLHQLDITKKPLKTHQGPGQGHGPTGSVIQGPTGIPYLQGIQIYQRQVKGADGKDSVKRYIMTFRVASEKHRDEGRWEHPGLPPVNIFDDAAKWAADQWEKEIAPKLITKILLQVSK
jgi:hypothetical protein